MNRPMYCEKCGTFFIADVSKGQRPWNYECPTCGVTRCAEIPIDSDRGVCILADKAGYPKAVNYRGSDSQPVRLCGECE